MHDLKRMDRRQAIKWMLTASAAVSFLDARGLGTGGLPAGYGRDPNLMDVHKPGDFWPLTFSAEQHRTVSALCDVLLPADERSPSASVLKVPDFIDEWVSAPYPRQQQDRKVVLHGLVWLEAESKKRFGPAFMELNDTQKRRICDDICSIERAPSQFKTAAEFFRTFRNLTMSGFYTTPAGMKDLQYVGNVPLLQFEGPPPEVLKFLKLD
jgi:hypothetical protein